MSTFELYFGMGRTHIMDFAAYDHILFIIALCVVYQWTQWKMVLILVTAFTIGHSLTLALASLGVLSFNTQLIEALIPVTILITAVGNILNAGKNRPDQKMPINYFFALFFGLIHGLGFSNYLTSLLGTESSILNPLFAFNLGLELGQLLIVLGFFLLAFTLEKVLHFQRQKWVFGVSSIIGLASIYLFINVIF